MLEELRKKIDEIDDDLIKLFEKRMKIVSEIGLLKKKTNSVINFSKREDEIISRVTNNLPDDLKNYAKNFFECIFNLSKSKQSKFFTSKLQEKIKNAIEKFKKSKFPKSGTVACQGVEGAFSSICAKKIFANPNIKFVKYFEDVFLAIEKKECNYGILPIENNTAGSINEIYDLLRKYQFYIIKSYNLSVEHHLLAKKETKLNEIKEIFSHPQAFSQCKDFLNSLKVKTTSCDNTAVAAQIVANSQLPQGAIASLECANIYGLEVLKRNIQTNKNNFTRFICVSKNLEIYPNSNKISIMATLPHKPGSLNQLLSKFSLLGLNLTKLESRPLGHTEFEYMFYFDFEGNITKNEVQNLIAEMENILPQFHFLGSYMHNEK